MRPSLSRIALVAVLAGGLALPALAQDVPQPATRTAGQDCAAASHAQPATQEVAAADATAPSNSGSTGWSGGTGGSLIGTNPSGASAHTKTWQPPTARGLDLSGRPEPAPLC